MFNYSSILFLALTATISSAVPIHRRAVAALNLEATAESHVRDEGATRAFSSVSIKTSDGNCLFVDELSGDFRANLTPVQSVACDAASDGQKWDVITAGEHNNVAGQALVVSAKTQACLNFDPRRAAGNQVLLFSCGGRAAGEGLVTDSQLFSFDATTATAPFPLVPKNAAANTCFTVVNGKLDQSACVPAEASGLQLFTIDGAASAPETGIDDETAPVSSVVAEPAVTSAVADPVATSVVAAPAPVGTGKAVLDLAATAEAQRRDDTATRAKSSVPIKTSDGQCLSVDPLSGDFRQNLIPVEVKACDGSAGQLFDVITKGVHNDQPGKALIVSALTQGCLNFDDRRQPGNQVLLFACGGRADGDGVVTNSQLFPFDGTSNVIPLSPANTNNGRCLFNNNGALDSEVCVATEPKATELFTLGGDAPALPPAPAPSAIASATSAASEAAASATSVLAAAPAPAATGKAVLDLAATAESQRRDDTATRAKSSVPIKTSDGQCLSVDPLSGDFRQNLIPVSVQACNGSPNQLFDVITKGVHNDQPGKALIVSALTQGCLNFDDRRQPGNKVLLFSCGGRADGDGVVTNSQLFPFDGTSNVIPLSPANTNNGKCLFNNNGALDAEACAADAPKDTELFTIG